MTTRPDMQPLANELDCAPAQAQRMVQIDEELWAEFERYAKATSISVERAIMSALYAFMGEVR